MKYFDDQAIPIFIERIQQLQRSARSTRDIVDSFSSASPLLREVSLALGRPDFGLGDEWKPWVTSFKLKSRPIFSHTFKDRDFLDNYMRPYQMFSPFEYRTDISIDIKLILTSLPELGLFLDNKLGAQLGKSGHDQRLFFSPAKWPFIAAELICKVYTNKHYKQDQVEALLTDFYPGVKMESLPALLDSGLFENPAEFCNWLMSNESAAPAEGVKVDLPLDF